MEWSGFAPFCVEAGAMTFAASASQVRSARVTKELGAAGSSCHPENARQLVGTARDLEKRRRKEREFHVHVSSL